MKHKNYTFCMAWKKSPNKDINAFTLFVMIDGKWMPTHNEDKDEKISQYRYRYFIK